MNPYVSEKTKRRSSGDRPNSFTITGFILAAAPVVILLLGFLFCLVFSGGQSGDNDMGAVWWLFVILLWFLIPITAIADAVSVILSIVGIRRRRGKKKTLFTYSGFIIIALELLAVLAFLLL